MVFLLTEGRKLIGYEIILKNIPGALRRISAIPEKYGLNIEYIETCAVSREIYILFLAIDFTDADENVTPELILDEYRKIRSYIINVNIAPSLHNIIYPSRLCIKDIGGMRAILLGLGNMRGIINGIKKNMGADMGKTFLFHLGYGVGREIYNIYGKPYGVKSLIEGVTLLTALVRGGGWADISVEEERENLIILKTEHLWECEVSIEEKDVDIKPASNYVRGILTGFFEALSRRKVVVKETMCIRKRDPHCQFEINIIRSPTSEKMEKNLKTY